MSQNVYKNIIKILKDGNYNYEKINHNEVKTTEESKKKKKKAGWIDGVGSKNIVFHAKGKFYLVVTTADREIKAKKFKKEFGTKDIRFAYEDELFLNTGCKIGAVTPFGHENKEIPIYVDDKILESNWFMFNPAIHTKSIRIKGSDLFDIYSKIGNSVKSFIEEEEGFIFKEVKKR